VCMTVTEVLQCVGKNYNNIPAMATYANIDIGPESVVKPRYRHQVLIGNWFEERALQDATFLPMNNRTMKREPIGDARNGINVNSEGVQQMNTTDTQMNGTSVLMNDTSNLQESGGRRRRTGTEEDKKGGIDSLRDYYTSTYRATRPGFKYMHQDPSAEDTARSQSSTNQNCRRCEQLRSKSGGDVTSCQRCAQLASTAAKDGVFCF